VAGKAGGTGAAVVDGVSGLRVDGADSSAVTAVILRLLGDAGTMQTLAENALARVQQELTWERVALRTCSIT
jgi:phosphatidylinositol alpha-1,6-mannosyltransferase